MMNATKRNTAFRTLVADTENTPFGQRLLELRAFATGAGCALKFDESGFELWSNNSPSARKLYKA